MLLNKGNISREHSESCYCVECAVALRCRRIARGLASPASERRCADKLWAKDPSRALVASEKALSTCAWVS